MGVRIREKIKGSGVWWLFINHQGVRKSKKMGSKDKAKKAQKIAIKHLAAGENGIMQKRVKSFRCYCEDWVNIWVPVNVKETTASDYRGIVKNHLRGAPFYNKPINKISKTDIQNFLDKKRVNLRWSTTSHIKHVIGAIFTRALDDDVIHKNPCQGTKISRDAETKEFTAYNMDEVQRLLDVFKETQYYTMVLFLVRTGCRTSEVAGLKWSDIDLNKRVATIRRGYVRGKIVETTKSNKKRIVDLTPDLVAELRQHRKAQLADSSQKSVWVFQKSGKMMCMNYFKLHTYDKKVAEAGLKPSRLHDLRHTYASILIGATGNMKYAQKQLGHYSIQITVDTYQHILDGDSDVRLVDVLDAPKTHLSAPKQGKIQTSI